MDVYQCCINIYKWSVYFKAFFPLENSLEANEERDINKSLSNFVAFTESESHPLLYITIYEYWNSNTKKVVQTHEWTVIGIPFKTTEFPLDSVTNLWH